MYIVLRYSAVAEAASFTTYWNVGLAFGTTRGAATGMIPYLAVPETFILHPATRYTGGRMKHCLHTSMVVMLAACLLASADCSQQRPAPVAGNSLKILPFSVVASGDSRVDIRSSETFVLLPEEATQAAGQTGDHDEALVREAIFNTLQEKGYRYATTPREADLLVHYLISMAGSDAGGGLSGNPGVQPSLNVKSPDPDKYTKGTLVIEVIDRLTGIKAWRSAAQGFAGQELTEVERRQRIGLMVERMLHGIPEK